MSDSTNQPPPGENGTPREGENADSVDPPPETSGGGFLLRLNLPSLSNWLSGQQERIFAWLDDTLSRQSGGADPFYLKTALPVLDRLAGIGAGLIAMIMVDRYYGAVGLGIFAWFFSLLAIAGYLGRYGIPVFVENRIARSPDSMDKTCANALAALLALGTGAVVVCTLSAFLLEGPGPGRADNILILLLGPTIFFQNINALRLAILNGTGRHGAAAGLRIRQRVVFLVATLVLCSLRVPVTLVAGAFLVSQIVMLGMGRKTGRLPAVAAVAAGCKHISRLLDSGRAFVFTDNLLDVVFYLDMLILGWFVSPVELGTYAQALILARLFLIIPGGLRPVFRRLANELVASGADDRLLTFMAQVTRGLFFIHGLLGVMVMLFFQQVLMMVYHGRHWAGDVFTVFCIVLPGLIFFSAVTALEPVFEARQCSTRLKQMTLAVAAVNLVLNINLIPFAGITGAAMATTGAMFIHYILFCRLLPAGLRRSCIFWPAAAAALYLTYALLSLISIGMMVTLLLAPVVFSVLLWMAGFFNPIPPLPDWSAAGTTAFKKQNAT